jgi:hypothetical protein
MPNGLFCKPLAISLLTVATRMVAFNKSNAGAGAGPMAGAERMAVCRHSFHRNPATPPCQGHGANIACRVEAPGAAKRTI